MQRRLSALAAMSALALTLTASPASASPVFHGSFPATEATEDGTLSCGPHTYTFTSGTFVFVSRDTTVGAHITAIDVHAVDASGTDYRVVGTETYADPTRFVSKLTFVSRGGGFADSINIVGHLSPNGSGHFFDFGTCAF